MSDKTCANCAMNDVSECSGEYECCPGTRNAWQPIPVATTDVKSNVPWHHMGEPNGMYNPDGSIRTWTSDVEWYREAIAKRDDLIRWMSDWLADISKEFTQKANELLGDVTNK